MKHIIIILTSLCITPFFAVGQEVFQGHKITCERVLGCAINNNGKTPQEYCPTCNFVKLPTHKSIDEWHKEIDEWHKQLKKNMGYDKSFLKLDKPKFKSKNGWGIDSPTWKGLRVLF
tara:strand:+ start:465 stop:815 length:351 start_codon:yes stop_codon:yes gene_type:complete